MTEPSRVPNMTIEEYLELEERSTARHEYVHGQLFAMTGASEAHNVICVNLITRIHPHLRGTGCRAFINDMKVRVEAANSFYYPDIMVTCEPFQSTSVFKTSPALIIEVLSPSTKHIDLREKLVMYRQLASLQEYVVVYQDRVLIEVYRKHADGEWEFGTLRKPDQLCLESLPGKPLQIPVCEVYDELDLPPLVREAEEEYQSEEDEEFEPA